MRSKEVVAVAATLAAATLFLPEPARAEEPGAESPRFNQACRRFQEGYVRSAARKLYRALRGDHSLDPVLLQPWIDAAIDGRPVRFALYMEHEGLVGGLVPSDSDYDTTYVVAQTGEGPVVAALTWEPAAGSCQVRDSRLAYPVVAGARVRPEPFRLWGQRVVWHIPRQREEGGARDPYAALVAVFRAHASKSTVAPAPAPPARAESAEPGSRGR